MTRCLLGAVLLFAACVPEDEDVFDETDELEAESTSGQGTTYQGTTYQGTTYQGTTYQGTTYQGTTYQGTTYQGISYGSGSSASAIVTKSTIETWRRISSGIYRWEQRLPDMRCLWDEERVNEVCYTYSLAQSPLIGARFRGQFYDATTGTTRTGYLRIKGVSKDGTYAMHPLNGAGTAEYKQPYNGTTCINAAGCRRNTDLYLYDLELLDSDGSVDAFCYPGEKAFAFAGTWDLTGKRTSTGGSRFTFACTNGTIAKCARWGYRPFGKATTIGRYQRSFDMAPYHQTCVRAATADYCANGTSFTKDGTLIDIYDYVPHDPNSFGFVPKTQSWLYTAGMRGATSLQWESTFDNLGATQLDFERYNEAGSVMTACPFQFALGTAPDPEYPHQPMDRDQPTTGPTIGVDTTTVCAHDEATRGKPLDFRCSACTTKFFYRSDLAHCIQRGSAQGWDATCVKAALDMCTATERMGRETYATAAHGECTAGGPIYQFGTACTLRLCGDPAYASCCTSSWTSTCTAAANSRCTGGLEGSNMFGQQIGFCGQMLPPVFDGGVLAGATLGGGG